MRERENTMELIGSRIKAMREFRGYTQGVLAYKSQTSAGHISLLENDERPGAHAATVARIAAALGTTVDYLVGLSDDPGIPPPRGQYWARESIRNALHNDSYAGYPSFGATRYEGAEPSPCYEPIWDRATHAAVIRERERRHTGPYVRSGGGPLTGVAVCARCGYHMTRMQSRGHWYLRCSTHNNRGQHGDGRECHSNYIREDEAIRVLSGYIKALATDDTLDRVFARLQEQQRADESAVELAELRYKVDSLDAQRERLALAYAAGDMALAYYRKADDQLEAQQETVRNRTAELERYLESLPNLDAQREQLRWLFEHFGVLMAESEPPTIAKALQDASFQLLVEEGRAWVSWAE